MASFVSQSLCRISSICMKTRAPLQRGSNGNASCMLFDIHLLKVTWIRSQRCNIKPFNQRSEVSKLKLRSSTSVLESWKLGFIASFKAPCPQVFLQWRKKFGSRVKQISRECNIKNLDTLSSFRKKRNKAKTLKHLSNTSLMVFRFRALTLASNEDILFLFFWTLILFSYTFTHRNNSKAKLKEWKL